MANRSIKLEQLKINSPCSESWDAMHGDDQSRFCDKCQLQVHNLSAMTRADAEQLVNSSSGRLCVQYAIRAEQIETTDSPRFQTGRGMGRWGAIAAAALAYVGLTSLMALAGDPKQNRMGDVACPPKPPEKPATQPSDKAVSGPHVALPEDRVLMKGKMAVPATQPAEHPAGKPGDSVSAPQNRILRGEATVTVLRGSPVPISAIDATGSKPKADAPSTQPAQ